MEPIPVSEHKSLNDWIAHICGWKVEPCADIKHLPFKVSDPNGGFWYVAQQDGHVPNYVGSLDDMAQAEALIAKEGGQMCVTYEENIRRRSWDQLVFTATPLAKALAFRETLIQFKRTGYLFNHIGKTRIVNVSDASTTQR